MNQESYNYGAFILAIISVVLNLATLCALIWYTAVTSKMQSAVSTQAAELNRQIGLSIAPAMVIVFDDGRNNAGAKVPQAWLKNAGNGTAFNIRPQQDDFSFRPMPYLEKGEKLVLEPIPPRQERFFGVEEMNRIEKVQIVFKDIEGGQYLQRLKIAQGICVAYPIIPIHDNGDN